MSSNERPWSISDRIFFIAFAASMGVHLLLLIAQLLSLDWFYAPKQLTAIEVIYEEMAAREELQLLQEKLARAKRDTTASPAPKTLGEQPQIRIPERPSLAAEHQLDDLMPGRAAVVDLTNLVDASRGDPVLLSYFSAIRQQIQQTANAEAWRAAEGGQGLVYVSFVLGASGGVREVAIVRERSVGSPVLQEVSRRIVEAAGPFPPFPPSMAEAQKTIVVPLEFLLES